MTPRRDTGPSVETVEFGAATDPAEMAARAVGLLKSMAHDSRLLLLFHLRAGEATVGALEELTGRSQTTVSQSLLRLRQDGLVQARRDGRVMFYRLSSAPAAQVLDLLATLPEGEP